MRNPELVLNSLAMKAKDEGYRFRRLYRNLYNEEFFLHAYRHLAPQSVGAKGINRQRIQVLIGMLRKQSYQPTPIRKEIIPQANGGPRPSQTQSLEDRLVQEVCRMLLEAIYEGSFSDDSHGFRTGRSCHTALMQVKRNFSEVSWFLNGDISGLLGEIDHPQLVEILKQRIEDERFINLIRKFLRAGYMENWAYHATFSGTPQGGILNPILANIYLDQLDRFVRRLQVRFEQGARNAKLSASSLVDEGNKKLHYVRVADRFLIGVIGSKEDVKGLRDRITGFISEQLHFSLSEERAQILHSSKPVRFLNYDVVVKRMDPRNERPAKRSCNLYVPKEIWQTQLLRWHALRIDGKGRWHALHRSELAFLRDIEILNIYNAQIEGFYHYYKLANNVSALNKFFYIMKRSLVKTFANKYRTSVSNVLRQYMKNGSFQVEYEDQGRKRTATLYNRGFKRDLKALTGEVDNLPSGPFSGRTRHIHKKR